MPLTPRSHECTLSPQRDIRRDELVMPERRWPYLSTQAPVGRKPMPDFATEANGAAGWKTTEKAKEMAKKLQEETRQKQVEAKRQADEEHGRQEAHKRVTKQVADRLKEKLGDPRDLRAQQREAERRRRQEQRSNTRERENDWKSQLDDIKERVAARPFLFDQQSIDTNAERAKDEAYDRLNARLQKLGPNLANQLAPH